MDPNQIPDITHLTTVTAIVAATVAVMQVLKGHLQDVPYVSKLPIGAVVLAVAVGLTLLAHNVFHTLEGDLKVQLWQACIYSLTAMGAVSALKNPTTTIQSAAKASQPPGDAIAVAAEKLIEATPTTAQVVEKTLQAAAAQSPAPVATVTKPPRRPGRAIIP